jgi:hypothetical protein
MRTALLLSVALFALLLTACGPRWRVVRQASPDPFAGKPDFTIEKIHFDHLEVGEKSEQDYLAGKDDQQRASWQADKEAMSEAFAVAVATSEQGLSIGPVRPNAAVVRPIVSFIEPGFYVGVAAGNTRVNISVQVLDAQGAVLDEITITSTIAASMTNSASGTRLRQAGEDLGHVTAKYLHTRVANE